MQLVELIYASTMVQPLSMDEVMSLLDGSRHRNTQHGVTGAMTFSRHCFLQVLEGSAREVNALYSKLMRDPRHADLTLISYGELPRRRFADWSMGFFKLNDQLDDDFQPYAMSAEQAIAHLSRLPMAAAARHARLGSTAVFDLSGPGV